MKTKEKKLIKTVKIAESNLLTLISSKLENRILFPEMVKKAKEQLNGANFSNI